MPVTVIKKPEWGLFYYYIKGLTTGLELIEAIEETVKNPIDRAKAVFDFLEGDFDVESKDIAKLIKINKQLQEKGKINTHIAVLTHNRTISLLINTMQLLSFYEESEMKVLTSTDAALEWMELSHRGAELLSILEEIRAQSS